MYLVLSTIVLLKEIQPASKLGKRKPRSSMLEMKAEVHQEVIQMRG